MKTTYTQGPWKVRLAKVGDELVNLVLDDSEEIGICMCGGNGTFEGESEANAHLIASAPALLAALKSLLNDVDTIYGAGWVSVHQAEKAIAKAEAL